MEAVDKGAVSAGPLFRFSLAGGYDVQGTIQDPRLAVRIENHRLSLPMVHLDSYGFACRDDVSQRWAQPDRLAALESLGNTADPLTAARARYVLKTYVRLGRPQAIETIRRLRGILITENGADGEQLVTEARIGPSWKGTDKDLRLLGIFPELRSVSFRRSSVSDTGLECLKNLDWCTRGHPGNLLDAAGVARLQIVLRHEFLHAGGADERGRKNLLRFIVEPPDFLFVSPTLVAQKSRADEAVVEVVGKETHWSNSTKASMRVFVC